MMTREAGEMGEMGGETRGRKTKGEGDQGEGDQMRKKDWEMRQCGRGEMMRGRQGGEMRRQGRRDTSTSTSPMPMSICL